MMVFLDASAFYAIWTTTDANHAQAARIQRAVAQRREPVTTTWYVVAETHALILSRQGHQRARDWLSAFAWPCVGVESRDLDAARRIIRTHEDHDYSLCDALSFTVMARLHCRCAFTFDRQFAAYGFEMLAE